MVRGHAVFMNTMDGAGKIYEDFHEIKCQREGERKEKKDLSVSLTLKSGRRTTKSIY